MSVGIFLLEYCMLGELGGDPFRLLQVTEGACVYCVVRTKLWDE